MSGGDSRSNLLTSVRAIVVRGVNWLGDAVMTTPALLRLREVYPAARIALLSPEKLAGLWRHHPAVDAVLAIPNGEGLWRTARRIRAERFDLGIVLPNSLRSALELWLGRVARRAGYAANGRAVFLTKAVARPGDFVPMRKRSDAEIQRLASGEVAPPRSPSGGAVTHHLHHYLRLVAAVGANPEPVPPLLRVASAEVTAARERFGLDDQVSWLGVNPGAEYGPAKRWPADRFTAVAGAAAAWPGWGVAVFGGPGDVAIGRTIEDAVRADFLRRGGTPRILNLAGRTTLSQLCAALSACRGLVTNDTGPMHLAAALGVPVVAVFGSTSPELTGPGLPGDSRHTIVRAPAPCAPCFRRVCPIDLRCLNGIEPGAVIEATRRAVGDLGPSASLR